MDAVCFYYHEHELAHIDTEKYGLADFYSLDEEPIVEKTFKRNGVDIPIYKTFKIAGTVLSKNDPRHSVSILTTTGVVDIKFTKEYFAMYNRQISEIQPDGTKKVAEAGWFKRGEKILVTGFRRANQFVAKSYANTKTHQLYKIVSINGSDIELVHERNGEQDD
jgi:DNA polymerase-3 subunit alpha